MNEESDAGGPGGPRRSARCHASSRRLDAAAAEELQPGLRFLLESELPEMLMKRGEAANKQEAEEMIKGHWPHMSPEDQNLCIMMETEDCGCCQLPTVDAGIDMQVEN